LREGRAHVRSRGRWRRDGEDCAAAGHHRGSRSGEHGSARRGSGRGDARRGSRVNPAKPACYPGTDMGSVESVPAPANTACGRTEASRTAPAIPVCAYQWIVLAFAAAIFLGCVFSPPHLLDDVDAVQAQIARNMVESGDWVTAHLDGIRYMEKAPLKYWLMAGCYEIFGVHDWAARLPIALAAVALCWLVFCMGRWAFSERTGFFAGLALATCIGLFLFTRFLIPDALLTVWIALALWGVARALDAAEKRPRLWAAVSAACIALGVL